MTVGGTKVVASLLHGPAAKLIGRTIRIRGTGGFLLSQMYARAWKPSPYPERVVPAGDGTLFRIDTNSFLEWQIFAFGGLQPAVTRLIRSLLRPGDVAIDVGANIGYQSIAMAKAVGRTGRVLAIEPVEELQQRLRANLTLNGVSKVEIVGTAVADKPGVVALFPTRPDSPNKAQASVIPHAHLDSASGFAVDGTTVDELVAMRSYEGVRLIKVDVEGFEPEVLAGTRNVLCENNPYVVFEFTPSYYRAGPEAAWRSISETFAVAKEGYEFYAIADRGAICPVSGAGPKFTCDVLAVPNALDRGTTALG